MKLDRYNKLDYVSIKIINNPNLSTSFKSGYDVPIEFIQSFQINFSSCSLKVTGSMLIDDYALINSFIQLRDCLVLIKYRDIFGNETNETFQITAANHIFYGTGNRGYDIEFQEYSSWLLENSYLGRSYSSGDLQIVLGDFLKELKYEKPIIGSLKFDSPLVVPKHINNLKFFEDEIFRMGGCFWRDRTGIRLSSHNDLQFSKLKRSEPFFNNSLNQHYKNRILELELNELTRGNVNPKIETMDFQSGELQYLKNDTFDISSYSTGNSKDILDTIGRKPVYQRLSKHDEMIRREMLTHNGMNIIVPGYCDREVNTVQDVRISGNKLNSTTVIEGDTVNSGDYLVSQIQDRFLNGQLLQKLFLRRPNYGKVLNHEDY